MVLTTEYKTEMIQDNPEIKKGILVTKSETGRKLINFLSLRLEKMPDCTMSVLQKWIRSGQVRVNGGRSTPYIPLKQGDIVRIPPFAISYLNNNASSEPELFVGLELPFQGKTQESNIAACSENPKLLFLEPELLVFFKPAGLAVQPGSNTHDSLSERLKKYFQDTYFVPAPAHRLDKFASGLVLCGRNQEAQQQLSNLLNTENIKLAGVLKNGELEQYVTNQKELMPYFELLPKIVQRTYLVWVQGRFPLAQETLLQDYLYLDYDAKSQKELVKASCVNNAKAKLALSLAKCLCVKQHPKLGFCSLLEVQLLSGRKHQIRVQMASRSFPVLGDFKYGNFPVVSVDIQKKLFKGLLLHAQKVALPDGRIFSASPPWKDFFAV
ncbi:RluA family pseudouridine synthase [Desulfovibrio litoralis]|uniref:Pseudouridylate synthase, 23S rRNA-or tRNA-specific n=1 Tax=Desulfovibrio litoralis DSM 11393 TaxID=1121455 RepID=A0A1M7RSA5_9BACT|nr:RluA family pseudouridine synthase [Desulfovibrio litoralis]SHN49139.1 Pseudouridylate synthase, 23S rRNA-or tRNA-specific [Desulfovibrio litoralis DSM 11393]